MQPLPQNQRREISIMSLSHEIVEQIEQTPFVDTHEHLFEESKRIAAARGDKVEGDPVPASDFGLLFNHYTDSDLIVAGMPTADCRRLISRDLDIHEKWRLVAPYYASARNTAYMLNLRETLRILYEEEDIREDNYERISEKIAANIRPGFYRRILHDAANISYAHVTCIDTPVFRETEQTDLFGVDLYIGALSGRMFGNNLAVQAVAKSLNREISSLTDWHELIDWCFATYGPRAVAVKCANAYVRRLDFAHVTDTEAAPICERLLRDPKTATAKECKALQDHLFHYCVRCAVEYRLPIKLHTGYHAGESTMNLHMVRRNAADVSLLLKAYPEARFVIMHILYPYQDEAIALAKHFPNAYVDMCWAWIMNPVAGIRFVKEFLMAAPLTKLLTFGGDYKVVEMIPGHARIARRGLTQALSELADSGWLGHGDISDVIARLMHGNAETLFDHANVQQS